MCVCVRERGQEIAYTDAIMLLVMDPSDEVCLELKWFFFLKFCFLTPYLVCGSLQFEFWIIFSRILIDMLSFYL